LNSSTRTDHPVNPVLRSTAPVAQSAHLFQGRQEIVIRHDGQDYRLRVTRQNKLILTK
jgi:hemin uptake protein HemP